MTPARSTNPAPGPWWAAAFGIVAFLVVPLLRTRPGRILADTDGLLVVDPARLLRDATLVWNPDLGVGAVDGLGLRLAWPTGPFFWLGDVLAVPGWAVQRLWIAALLSAAAIGVLYLARTLRWAVLPGIAAATAYVLSPVVLARALDGSVGLLPYAALPWLLAMSIRATRSRGWRHPAVLALVIATILPGDPLGTILVMTVPGAWFVYAGWSSERIRRSAVSTTVVKAAVLTVAVNLWWLIGASVQATNGLGGARFHEPSSVAADASTASEVLRGLGDWAFYSTSAASTYQERLLVLAASFALPIIGVLALGIVRWRHRAFLIIIAVIGLVVAVGAHPWSMPSPIGAALREALQTDQGQAWRDMARATPILTLALAAAVGSLVAAIDTEGRRAAGLLVAIVIAIGTLSLPGLWTDGFAPDGAGRPDDLDAPWPEVVGHLEASTTGRVLVLPGASPDDPTVRDAALRAEVDRPVIVRELRPQGSVPSTELIAALDDAARSGTLSPAAVAPVARLLGVSHILVRPTAAESGDDLRRVLASATGLGERRSFGDGVMAFTVTEPRPIISAHRPDQMVILSGDANGIIDAASAGVIDGTELTRFSGSLTGDAEFVVDDLVDQRRLVITDSNRRAGRHWLSLEGTRGFTEQPEGGLLDDDPLDERLSLFDDDPNTATVAEHQGLSARATSYGATDSLEPQYRPANAADGDPTSAWVLSASDAEGERLELRADTPVTTDHIRLRQLGGLGSDATAGSIERLVLRFDGDDPLTVDLDARSRTPGGQRIDIGRRTFGTLDLQVDAVSTAVLPGVPGDDRARVGIAEVAIAELKLREALRMPTDLLDRGGFRTQRYPLTLVQTRSRDARDGHVDEEARLSRVVELPTRRRFQLTGTARRVEQDTPVTGECRSDLVRVGGDAVPVRLTPAELPDTFAIEACDGPIILNGGRNRIRTAATDERGIAVDQLVWCSAAGGAACASSPTPWNDATPPARIGETSGDDATIRVEISAAEPGRPFWLTLNQSFQEGWELIEPSEAASDVALVNGYANGFLVTPEDPDFTVTLRFGPQNRVDIGVVLSLLAAVATLLLAVSPARPRGPAPIPLTEPLRSIRALSWEGALPTRSEARWVALVVGVLVGVVAHPLAGLGVGVAAAFAIRRETWRPLFTVLPAVTLTTIALYLVLQQYRSETPSGLGWVASIDHLHPAALTAVVLLLVDVVIDRIWARGSEFS